MIELSSPRMILTPVDRQFQLKSNQSLVSALTDIGLIAEYFTTKHGADCYKTGDAYLQFVTYLGCAPVLSYIDDENSGYNLTFISLINSRQMLFDYCSPKPPPRCPNCGHGLRDWQPVIHQWQQQPDNNRWQCTQCHRDIEITRLKWRKNAGFGHVFLQLHGIQEQLAVPNEGLLSTLEQTTNTKWHYFYACQHNKRS